MKKKLTLLNLALVALIVLAGWRARQSWLQAQEREQALVRASQKPSLPPPLAPLRAVEPVSAAGYLDVAEKMLFAPDRNPTVILEPVKPKPMPPLPVAYGVVNLGDGPMAILSEKSGSPNRAFRAGDTIGEFKLVAVNAEELVFGWEGQQVAKKLEDLRERPSSEASSSAEAASRAPGPPPPPVQMQAPVTERPLGPGESSGGVRVCQPGDSSPPGAVVDGFRKVVSVTPFGRVCRWEPVQ